MLHQGFDFHFLLHSAHLLEERLRARLMPLGVHPRQARVLDVLGRMGKASQVTLAKELDLTAASMSTMTVRLLEAGLIERQVDEHELRSNVLRLSKRGKSLLKSIHREWQGIDREISDTIGPKNARNLAGLTYQLRNALGGSTPGEPSAKDEETTTSSGRRTRA